MARRLRRYEILLPLSYNDGSPVEPEKFEDTRSELLSRFRGVTFDPTPRHGLWTEKGERFEDVLVRVTVDAPNTPEARRFFEEYKESLKERFQQYEVYITHHTIERV